MIITFYKFLLFFVNLVFPGSIFVWVKKYRTAFLIQGALLISVCVLSWSRLVFSECGFISLIFIIAALYIINNCWALYELSSKEVHFNINALIKVCAFIILTSAGFCYGFVKKDKWLGVHIYFIPSPSMLPTLLPGDFILIDSWKYRKNKPTLGDIIIFTTEAHEGVLVKRIQPWPAQQTNNDEFFVMGDNRNESLDSRKFGGIKRSQIKGQVMLVLCSINPDLSFRKSRWIKKPENLIYK